MNMSKAQLQNMFQHSKSVFRATIRLRRAIAVFGISLLLILTADRAVMAERISFQWAILADSTEGMRALDFTGSPIVFSGTALQLYIEHLNNCHVYLFLLDASENLTPIYPPRKGFYDFGFPRGPKLVPPGDNSFAFVPPPGIETLLLIASTQRLFQLEELTDIFNQDPSQFGQQKLLLTRIEDLFAAHEDERQASERLEKVTVKYRAADGIKEKSFKATRVKGAKFYGRKLQIDHR